MNLKKSIGLILILNQLTFAQEPSTYYNNVISELNNLDKKIRQYELFKKLISKVAYFKTAEEIIPYLDWLKLRTLNPENSSFRYATLYGIYLSKVGQKDTSKTILLHSLLRLELDILRCDKSKDAITKYIEWKSGIQKHLKRNTISIDKRSSSLIINIEDLQHKRKGDKWLCGDIDFVKAIKKGNYNIEKQGNITNVSTIPSNDVLLPVTFINEEKWQKIRKK